MPDAIRHPNDVDKLHNIPYLNWAKYADKRTEGEYGRRCPQRARLRSPYFDRAIVYDAMSSCCKATESCWIFTVSRTSMDPPTGLVPNPVNGAVVK